MNNPKPSGSNNNADQKKTLRFLVAITPMAGVLAFPVLVPLTINKSGIEAGIGVALILSTLWFVMMLRTSEMPH